jgi:hypothetical protein
MGLGSEWIGEQWLFHEYLISDFRRTVCARVPTCLHGRNKKRGYVHSDGVFDLIWLGSGSQATLGILGAEWARLGHTLGCSWEWIHGGNLCFVFSLGD